MNLLLACCTISLLLHFTMASRKVTSKAPEKLVVDNGATLPKEDNMVDIAKTLAKSDVTNYNGASSTHTGDKERDEHGAKTTRQVDNMGGAFFGGSGGMTSPAGAQAGPAMASSSSSGGGCPFCDPCKPLYWWCPRCPHVQSWDRPECVYSCLIRKRCFCLP